MKQKILFKLWKITSKIYNYLTKKIIAYKGDTAKCMLNSLYGTMVYTDTDSVQEVK